MAKRYFEFSEGTSNKFWEVWMEGNEVRTRYGKIGTPGQITVKDEGSPEKAQKLHDKLVREKTGKGYEEKTAGGAAAAPAAPAPAAPAAAKPAPKPAPAPKEDAGASATAKPGGARRFEFSEGTSNKFWEVWMEGNQVRTRYGKIGTEGQITVKDEGSPEKAQKLHDKLIGEKTKKGYAEV